MNGYAAIHVYRGLWRNVGPRGGEYWERVTSRPGHVVSLVLPEYLNTYDARREYPELSHPLGAPHWAALWWWDGNGWRKHREWASWQSDTGAPTDSATQVSALGLAIGLGILYLLANDIR